MMTPLDVDILAFFAGGQFFEEDVVDEQLACFTDGQFGIEIEAPVIPPPRPIAASTGGGGGGGSFVYAAPAGQCWAWDEGDKECDNIPSNWKFDDFISSWQKESPGAAAPRYVPIDNMGGMGVVVDDGSSTKRIDWKTLMTGVAIGAVTFAVAQWAVRAWVRYERRQLDLELGYVYA